MIRQLAVSAAAIAVAWLVGAGNAGAADRNVTKAPAAPAPAAAALIEDCSAFYDDYRQRGFGWGTGPGASLGFGAFEGALPRYILNEFPNWYGACQNWGAYSSSGTAFSR